MDTLQTTTPAILHHLHLTSPDSERLSRYYASPLELSAELETFTPEQTPRIWPNTEYTLNYWGSAWMRS